MEVPQNPYANITKSFVHLAAQICFMKNCWNPSSMSAATGACTRHYHPNLSIWLSVDPMSDKYPSMSPYTYCANNPVKLVDPDGREYIIDGEDSKSIKAAFAQLQASTHLQLKMDKNGKVRIIGGEESTDYDTQLKEAINSSTISVTIHTTSYDTYSDDTGKSYSIPGGSHFGTHYDPETKTAKAEQVVNPYLLGAMDLSCGRAIGTSMAHEALEAYFCGTIAIDNETDIQKAIQGNPTYYLWEQAHNLAPEQPDYTGIYGWTPTGWYGLANCLYLYNTKIRENPTMPIQFLMKKDDFWHMKVPSELK